MKSKESKREEQPGYVRIIRYIFAVLASLFVVFVTVQVFFAGLATFVDVGNWSLHKSFVRFFAMMPVVLIVLAFAGRLSRAARWQSFGLFVMIILQFITVNFAANISYLSALHPVIALGLFWTSYVLMRKAWKQSLEPRQQG
jgi:putative tricarboxylic transport membrane protein